MAIFEDFMKIDVRVGKIIHVQDFPEARKPSFKLRIDFGKEIGIKRSCAQLTANYNKQVLAMRSETDTLFKLCAAWWLFCI